MKILYSCAGFLFASLLGASTALAVDDVPYLTVTSRDGTNQIEWLNPTGSYSFTRIIGRTDRFAAGPTDFGPSDFVADDAGTAGQTASVSHSGLTNETRYFYTAFVNDGSGFSSGVPGTGRPVDTAGPAKWAFHNGAGTTSMAPPGIGIAVFAVTNDFNLYAMERGADGGSWPPGGPRFRWAVPPSIVPSSSPSATSPRPTISCSWARRMALFAQWTPTPEL